MTQQVRPHTVKQLEPGFFFSPGYYMGYWRHCIERDFTPETIRNHTKLQKHREMYAGAIMAAGQTKATGIRHYVGLPDDEPSDVDIVRLVEVTLRSGRRGTNLERLHIQLTECDFSRGETLMGQFLKKNKPAYANIIVGIHALNRTEASHFSEDCAELQQLSPIYPSTVITLESVEIADGVRQPTGTFGLTALYPEEGASLIHISDSEAFFTGPDVFSQAARGVSTEWEDLGSFELMPPSIDS